MQGFIHTKKTQLVQLLRWSEKYTKTDMVYLAGNGFWLMLAQGVGAVSAFAVTVLLTNLLPKETFGQYRFILSVIPILAIFTLPGIGTALTRAVARGAQIDLREIAKTKIKWGLLGSLAALIVALYYYTHGNMLLTYTFGISALFIPFYEAFFIYSFYHKGLQDFKTPAIYESASKITQAIIMMLVAVITKDILLLITTFFVGQILTRGLSYYLTIRNINTTHPIINAGEDGVISYGKSLTIISILGVITVNMDKLLVWHTLGAVAFATYIVTLVIPTQVSKTISMAHHLFLPRFSKKFWSSNDLTPIIKRIIISIFILTCITIVTTFLTNLIYPHLFTKYESSLHLVKYVMPLIILVPLRDIFIAFLLSQKKQQYVTITLAISMIFYIVAVYQITLTVGSLLILLVLKEAVVSIIITLLSLIYIYKLKHHE